MQFLVEYQRDHEHCRLCRIPRQDLNRTGGWFITTFEITEKGKQMNESLLIDFEEAGRLLGGLHPNTLRQRKGGTENLTHVSGFGRRVMLVREEVNALVESKIAQARAAERDRRKMLRRAS